MWIAKDELGRTDATLPTGRWRVRLKEPTLLNRFRALIGSPLEKVTDLPYERKLVFPGGKSSDVLVDVQPVVYQISRETAVDVDGMPYARCAEEPRFYFPALLPEYGCSEAVRDAHDFRPYFFEDQEDATDHAEEVSRQFRAARGSDRYLYPFFHNPPLSMAVYEDDPRNDRLMTEGMFRGAVPANSDWQQRREASSDPSRWLG